MRSSARIFGIYWFFFNTSEILAVILDTKEIPTEEKIYTLIAQSIWLPNIKKEKD